MSASADHKLINFFGNQFLLIDEKNESIFKITLLAFKGTWQWTGIKKFKEMTNSQGQTKYTYHVGSDNIVWTITLNPTKNGFIINSQINSKENIPITYFALDLSSENTDINSKIKTDSIFSFPLLVNESNNIEKIEFLRKKAKKDILL